ncbi:MAG: hypothetical protein MUO85_07885, partial [candidate division Zixibacteria bacterium]|nr:hypothetical protein [candidate division Zixibacteria bacterium]
MKSERKCLVTIFVSSLILFLFSSAWSYDTPGTSVRATGMGGSFTAIANDPSAVFYNPAGLVQLKGVQFYLMYDRETMYGVDSAESPYLGVGVITIPLSRDIVVALAGYQDGSWADPTRIVTKNIGLLSFSSWVTEELSFGLNLKGLYNSNYGKKKGFDFDLGLLYQPYPWLSIGAMGENLARTDMVPDISSGVVSGYQTRQVKLGLAYRYSGKNYETCLALDNVIKYVNQPLQKSYSLTSIGMEQWILTDNKLSLALRGGYGFGKNYELDYSQPAFGGSIKYRAENYTIQLDYSWSKYPYESKEDLAGDHRIGLVLSLEKGVKRGEKLLLKEEIKEEKKEEAIKEEAVKEVATVEEKKEIPITPPSTPIEEEKESYPAKPEPEFLPAEKDSAKGSPGILTYNLNSEIEFLSVGKNRSVMFLLKPGITQEIERWKLYIWSALPTGWNKEEVEKSLVKTFEGWGNPSFGVMWDCKYNDVKVKSGIYYYALALKDNQGVKWYSQIKSFKL